MSDLLSILPSFPLTSFTHNIVSSLENHSITTSDLLTLDIVDVSRRTAISLLDVRRFSNEVMQALHRDLEGTNEDLGSTTEDGQQPVRKIGESGFEVWRGQRLLSTTDRAIDQILGGGLMTGCITEFVGER